MLFNSLEFIVFFALVLWINTIIPGRKWIFLLIASYYFYCCSKFEYLPLLLAITLLNYFCAIGISESRKEKTRHSYLTLSVVGTIGILFFYKYYNFFGHLISSTYRSFGVPVVFRAFDLALPIGISFYSFQALGYTIDVFSRKIKAEKHIGFFSLFIAFFPQLLAGPIGRAENLLTQLRQDHPFDYGRVSSGFQLAVWGLFKKMVIADRLAAYVDAVYNNVHDYTGLPLLLSTYFFAFQIYCDFSGYSDIAIGCARMLGYDLRINFDRPYFSASLPEFWRRWHMSLMSWFRDYLYFPLGGSRKGEIRKHANQFIVFLLSGLWHGANLTFVYWGVYHGVLQILSNLSMPLRKRVFSSLCLSPRILRAFGVFITFCLVSFGWMLFRANSIQDILYFLQNMPKDALKFSAILIPISQEDLIVAFLLIAFLIAVELVQSSKYLVDMFEEVPQFIRFPLFLTLILALMILGVFEEKAFLYFQF